MNKTSINLSCLIAPVFYPAHTAAKTCTHSPTTSEWMVWDPDTQAHVDSGFSAIGAAGHSFMLLDAYKKYADLMEAHPVGSPGDAYMIGADANRGA